jgi:hypothetical protein
LIKNAIFALAATISVPSSAQVQAVDLGWLSGLWESGPDLWIETRWSEPRGGMLIGHARYGQGDAALGFEFFRVQPGEDGVLVYHAQPEGREAVLFRLAEASATAVSFENAEHEFPQRIRYVRDGERLTATLSLIDGTRAQVFAFNRR